MSIPNPWFWYHTNLCEWIASDFSFYLLVFLKKKLYYSLLLILSLNISFEKLKSNALLTSFEYEFKCQVPLRCPVLLEPFVLRKLEAWKMYVVRRYLGKVIITLDALKKWGKTIGCFHIQTRCHSIETDRERRRKSLFVLSFTLPQLNSVDVTLREKITLTR